MKARRMVIVSDIHAGSRLALCPPRLDEELHCRYYPIREWMYAQWQTFTAEVLEYTSGEPFVLALNGDLLEGLHHGAHDVLWKSHVRQFRAAVELLKPFVGHAAACYIVEGTQCHTMDDEHDIAEAMAESGLNIVKPPTGWAWSRLKLSMNGLTHSIRHHIPATSRPWLETGAPGAAIASERLNSLNAREEPSDVVIAAHRHTGGYVKSTSGMTVVTPSWQFPTRHVYKVVPEARPVVGSTMLDYARCKPREFAFVKEFHYRPEPDKAVSHD